MSNKNISTAVITERTTLSLPENVGTGVIETRGARIVAAGTEGSHFYEWKLDEQGKTSDSAVTYSPPASSGRVTKLKFWDENTLSYCTEKGLIALYDLRKKDLAASFSATRLQAETSSASILYSFDCIPQHNTIGVVDSCGGYESFDIRSMKEERSRTLLPGASGAGGLLKGKFNMEYEPNPRSEGKVKFIVTGMKEDVVQIYEDKGHGIEVSPVFAHDGHSKPVSHALWHPLSEGLLFSTSIDSVLHAWQYNERSSSIETS
jgi:WD40 repeat protein